MGICKHKTEKEYKVCNLCTSMRRIAVAARKMLEARKAYIDQLLIDPSGSDKLQYDLGEQVRKLEDEVKLATIAGLWKDVE